MDILQGTVAKHQLSLELNCGGIPRRKTPYVPPSISSGTVYRYAGDDPKYVSSSKSGIRLLNTFWKTVREVVLSFDYGMSHLARLEGEIF